LPTSIKTTKAQTDVIQMHKWQFPDSYWSVHFNNYRHLQPSATTEHRLLLCSVAMLVMQRDIVSYMERQHEMRLSTTHEWKHFFESLWGGNDYIDWSTCTDWTWIYTASLRFL